MLQHIPQPSALAILDRVDQDWFQHDDFNNWTAALVGTGATTRTIRKCNVRTGTTASSTASARTTVDPGYHRGKNINLINWSKKLVLHFPLSQSEGTTNGKSRLTLGKASGTGVGELAVKGIGIQLENRALKGLVHNGTTLVNVDLATTLTDEIVYHVVIKADGLGRVEWFVNGVSKGSSAAGGPTGDSAANENLFQLEAENNADAASQGITIHNLKAWFEQ